MAALFGTNLSGASQSATSQPLPATLADASVTLKDSRGNEHLAPLFFVSPNQINFLLPPNLPLGPATLYAVNNGDIHSTGALEIVTVSPGLFSADALGAGLAAAVVLRVKGNGEQVYEPAIRFDAALNRPVAVPIDVGNPAEQVFLLLFGTGFRQRSTLANVIAQIGGAQAEVTYAGAQGDLAGLDQCNVRLPATLAGRGEVSVVLMVDGKTSNTLRAYIK